MSTAFPRVRINLSTVKWAQGLRKKNRSSVHYVYNYWNTKFTSISHWPNEEYFDQQHQHIEYFEGHVQTNSHLDGVMCSPILQHDQLILTAKSIVTTKISVQHWQRTANTLTGWTYTVVHSYWTHKLLLPEHTLASMRGRFWGFLPRRGDMLQTLGVGPQKQ